MTGRNLFLFVLLLNNFLFGQQVNRTIDQLLHQYDSLADFEEKKQCQAIFKKAFALSDKYDSLWYRSAEFKARLKDYKGGAIEDFTRATELNPGPIRHQLCFLKQ